MTLLVTSKSTNFTTLNILICANKTWVMCQKRNARFLFYGASCKLECQLNVRICDWLDWLSRSNSN